MVVPTSSLQLLMSDRSLGQLRDSEFGSKVLNLNLSHAARYHLQHENDSDREEGAMASLPQQGVGSSQLPCCLLQLHVQGFADPMQVLPASQLPATAS